MKNKINLLPPKKERLSNQITYFLLNYLRYIIVITQLVVIIVFFYRFQIDQKIIDLKEEISQKKEIIKTVKPLLDEATIIDKKSTFLEKVIQDQDKLKEIFNYFLSFLPQTINLTKFELNDQGLKLVGLSTNINHLQTYINLLNKDKKFKKINLSSLKKTTSGYIFNLELEEFR